MAAILARPPEVGRYEGHGGGYQGAVAEELVEQDSHGVTGVHEDDDI